MLTADTAYKAMLLFWIEIANRTESADIYAALAECQLLASDGKPVDRARFQDFLDCIEQASAQAPPEQLFYQFCRE